MVLTFFLLMSTGKPEFILWWNDFQVCGCSNCTLCQNIHIYRSLQFCVYAYRALYTQKRRTHYLHVERNIYVYCAAETREKLIFALMSEREELSRVQEHSLVKCLSCVSTHRVTSVSRCLGVFISLHLFIRFKN